MTAIALTIAGSDSSAGAGIQADLKTFSALGVYGATVIASLTAQNTLGVQGVFDIPAPFVRQQLDSVFDDLAVAAVKIGMLSSSEIMVAVAEGLAGREVGNIVLDPVMISTSGHRLIAPDAIETLRRHLIPRALLVTPNLPEAAALLDDAPALDEAGMVAQAKRIRALGASAVLVKGGHGVGAESVDILVDAAGVQRFAAARVATRNTHGTGCTLSAGIAAGLAKGLDLRQAVEASKRYLTAAIGAADELAIGHGSGPVHHFFALWRNDQPG
jgi:hydroxymethylpyrimidine/phosphomethylpyrimidine kinase